MIVASRNLAEFYGGAHGRITYDFLRTWHAVAATNAFPENTSSANAPSDRFSNTSAPHEQSDFAKIPLGYVGSMANEFRNR